MKKIVVSLMTFLFLFITLQLSAQDGRLSVSEAQKKFITTYGFRPGSYVKCRSQDNGGCLEAKNAFLSDPWEHQETVIIFFSDGMIDYTSGGLSLPDEAKRTLGRSGNNIKVYIEIPSQNKELSFTFKPYPDHLESVTDGLLYILAIDAVTMDSAG
jgi:hypothetical protein